MLRLGNLAFQVGEKVKVKATGYTTKVARLRYPLESFTPDQASYFVALPKQKNTDPDLTPFKYFELELVSN